MTRPAIVALLALTVAGCGGGNSTADTRADAEPQVDLPKGVVAVYPTPGTIAASPESEISFRGRALRDIGDVRVSGSRSGDQTGRLVAHSDGNGVSWVPSKNFRGGETVNVTTALPITQTEGGDFSFRVARTPERVDIAKRFLEDTPPGKRASFLSRPDLEPPVVTVDPEIRGGTPGYVILSPKSKIDVGQAGPMIVDNEGRHVWFKPLPGITAATDVRVQTYKGNPVITYWEGTSRQGIGYGRLVMRDESYRVIKTFNTPNGYRADLHEFLITPQDTALVIAYPAVRADLSELEGPSDGQVIDSVIQEIDIETGRVIFEWHSLGEIPLADSYSEPPGSPRVPFDYFHANSVAVDDDGDIIVSARNTWGVYKIDRMTGKLEWTLGGKRSTFELPDDAKFAWQHDARRRDDGALTIFDNSAFPPVRKFSRALALKLDEKNKTVTLLSAWSHPRKLLAATQGSMQNVKGGGAFVNWGSQRYFTEYDAAGKPVWDARLAVGYESYRGYRSAWVGRPATKPSVAARRRGDGSVEVFASWNGSTETRTWEVLAGPSPSQLEPVTRAPRAGFETTVPLDSVEGYVAVRALDERGEALSTSPAQRVRG